MVNHLLETSHPISSSAPRLTVPAPQPSSILRTHFQVPYPVSPLLATLTKSAGVWGHSSHFGSPRTTCAKGTRFSFRSTFHGSDFSMCPRSYLSPYVVTSLPPPFLHVSSR